MIDPMLNKDYLICQQLLVTIFPKYLEQLQIIHYTVAIRLINRCLMFGVYLNITSSNNPTSTCSSTLNISSPGSNNTPFVTHSNNSTPIVLPLTQTTTITTTTSSTTPQTTPSKPNCNLKLHQFTILLQQIDQYFQQIFPKEVFSPSSSTSNSSPSTYFSCPYQTTFHILQTMHTLLFQEYEYHLQLIQQFTNELQGYAIEWKIIEHIYDRNDDRDDLFEFIVYLKEKLDVSSSMLQESSDLSLFHDFLLHPMIWIQRFFDCLQINPLSTYEQHRYDYLFYQSRLRTYNKTHTHHHLNHNSNSMNNLQHQSTPNYQKDVNTPPISHYISSSSSTISFSSQTSAIPLGESTSKSNLGTYNEDEIINEADIIYKITHGKALTNEEIQYRNAIISYAKIPSELFHYDKEIVLHDGTFGIIYQGNYQNHIVSLKYIKVHQHHHKTTNNTTTNKLLYKEEQTKERNAISELMENELLLSKYLGNHPNIVNYFGLYQHPLKHYTLGLVSEYSPYGPLNKFLYCRKDTKLFPLSIIMSWCLDILSVLTFLHSKQIKFYELELKNILLFHGYHIKVYNICCYTDEQFIDYVESTSLCSILQDTKENNVSHGLQHHKIRSNSNPQTYVQPTRQTSVQSPPKHSQNTTPSAIIHKFYMNKSQLIRDTYPIAPEVIEERTVSFASDIYSFGMIMCQLFIDLNFFVEENNPSIDNNMLTQFYKINEWIEEKNVVVIADMITQCLSYHAHQSPRDYRPKPCSLMTTLQQILSSIGGDIRCNAMEIINLEKDLQEYLNKDKKEALSSNVTSNTMSRTRSHDTYDDNEIIDMLIKYEHDIPTFLEYAKTLFQQAKYLFELPKQTSVLEPSIALLIIQLFVHFYMHEINVIINIKKCANAFAEAKHYKQILDSLETFFSWSNTSMNTTSLFSPLRLGNNVINNNNLLNNNMNNNSNSPSFITTPMSSVQQTPITTTLSLLTTTATTTTTTSTTMTPSTTSTNSTMTSSLQSPDLINNSFILDSIDQNIQQFRNEWKILKHKIIICYETLDQLELQCMKFDQFDLAQQLHELHDQMEKYLSCKLDNFDKLHEIDSIIELLDHKHQGKWSHTLLQYLFMTKEYTFIQSMLHEIQYTCSRLFVQGYSCYEVKCLGYSLSELLSAGYSINDLLTEGQYSSLELYQIGCTALEFHRANISLTLIKDLGIPLKELYNVGYTYQEIQEAGYNLTELLQIPVSIKDLYESFHYSIEMLLENKLKFTKYDHITLQHCIEENISLNYLLSHGYTIRELIEDFQGLTFLRDQSYSLTELFGLYPKVFLENSSPMKSEDRLYISSELKRYITLFWNSQSINIDLLNKFWMKAFTMRAMTYEHLVFLTQLPINLSIHESIDGRNVLMCVIKNQQLPMIQYLYENISNPFHDIYTQDNNGDHILIYACVTGNYEIIKYLIENTFCPFHDILLDNQERELNALMIASYEGHLHIIKYLIQMSIILHLSSESLELAIENAYFIASGKGHLSIVQYFLENELSGNSTLTDDDGKDALMYACEYGYLPMVQYLIEKCLPLSHNLSTKCKNGMDVFLYACQNGHSSIIKYLIENNRCPYKTIHTTNKEQHNGLMFAVMIGNLPIIQYLIENTFVPFTDTQAVDNQQKSVLMLAVEYNQLEIIKYLLNNPYCSFQSALYIKDYWNQRNCLMYAIEFRHLEIMEYLMTQQFYQTKDYLTVDKENKTAYQLSKRFVWLQFSFLFWYYYPKFRQICVWFTWGFLAIYGFFCFHLIVIVLFRLIAYCLSLI